MEKCKVLPNIDADPQYNWDFQKPLMFLCRISDARNLNQSATILKGNKLTEVDPQIYKHLTTFSKCQHLYDE